MLALPPRFRGAASPDAMRPWPLVIAHRGASARAAEHTVTAYQRAIADGADGLECDVRLTSDGHLVCVHDRRVDRTSDGRGPVSGLELAQLHEFDFASWRADAGRPVVEEGPDGVAADADTAVPISSGTGVLTLDALLSLAHDGPRRVPVHIETKHPTRFAGLVEQRLSELLASRGLTEPETRSGVSSSANPYVTVMSFSPASLRRIRLLTPAVPTVLLMGPRRPPRRRSGLLPPGVRIAGPSIEVLRAWPDYVARAHSRGHRVHAWTVDAVADLDYVHELGVDAVITNRPETMRERLGR